MDTNRDQWSSRIGFILATAGSAVGLGNIWKFPYLVGEHGGAAFIIVYLICVVLVGLPVVIAEILIGRTGQLNSVGSFRKLSNHNPFWSSFGFLGVLTCFIILTYYNVIAGWSLGYVVESIKASFSEMNHPDLAANLFLSLSQTPQWGLLYYTLFMVFTVIIIYFGISRGIEKASKILMPLLLILIIAVVIRGVTLEGSSRGIRYLTKVDFSAITPHTILIALGQAFFSLSLGMGALLTYGSYFSKKDNIVSSAVSIVGLDTLVALLAGFMIFPALFAMGLHPEQGPALIFNVLPVVFNSIPGGYYFRIIFFVLLSLAALTSTISLLEVLTTYVVDEWHLSRKLTAILAGLLALIIGIPDVLSFGKWSRIRILGLTFFNLMDFLAANILLPLGGLFIALFVGWFWGRKNALPNLREGAESFPGYIFTSWRFLIRFVSPVLILLIFLSSLGII
jgi:NSS family neurotransmitter:Na+ symporter